MNRIFAIYPETHLAEAAVDLLISAGIPASAISVLHPDNESSRAFAERKSTRLPAGTGYGETWHLAQMGVPVDWCAGQMLEGKLLLSAETRNADQQACAEGIVRYTRAEKVAAMTNPENAAAAKPHDGR